MSRYIDGEKSAMHLADYQYSIPYGCIDESAEDMGAYMAVGECLKAIDEQPTIDIVRCKECRHWIGETEYYEDREYKACWQLCGQYMNSEFWCKYGESKESE